MVHALREAHRVLKPEGLLLDVRPAPVHRRVGLMSHARQWKLVAPMRENLDDDRAANAAVKTAIRERLFKRQAYASLGLNRHIDTISDFRAWLQEFSTLGPFPPHDWMVRKVETALANSSRKTKLVVRGPLEIRVLRKLP
ncbi:MAG TPA: hypothetical protein VJP78_15780 [Thermoleophilia bacterium]|nr:hypothetical protein [Thermoleophilia bacterium]